MAKLINGNGNPAVYAAEDADLIASIMGDKTSICNLGSKFAATASGANVIEVADGVIITKEGRRIQLDSGSVDEFSIPAGTVGTTNYYIIGYKLYENAQVQQVCETFVQLMPNSTDVIQEDTFKGGATEVYVSLYRVEQDGVNLGTITALLPEIGNISEKTNKYAGTSGGATYVTVDSIGYDSTNKKLGLKVNGADTVIPFSGGQGWKYAIWYNGYVTNASRGAIYDSTVPNFKCGPSASTPPEDLLNSEFVTKATPDHYPWGQYAWAVTVKKPCKLKNNTSGDVSSISTGTTLKFGYQNTYNGDYTLYFE